MSLTISPVDDREGSAQSELFRQIHELSLDQKEHLLVLLQENIDGGPFVGDVPELPGETATEDDMQWRDTLARRLDEMLEDRVERIDAHGSALRMLNRALEKYSP